MKNLKSKKSESREAQPKGIDEDLQLEEFFLNSLKDIYWAEQHLTKAIPKLIAAATTVELRKAFEEHLSVTKQHVVKLESVFEILDEKPHAKKCEAMAGITKEAETIIEETVDGSLTRDVGLIMAAQKVEHYEIATYGTLIRLANAIDRQNAAAIFSTILDEEKEADTTLSGIAENHINMEAAAEKR